MGRIVVVNHVTLDGVMQSPSGLDEDQRGGFDRGGWAVPYGDAVKSAAMAEGMAGSGALLFGRVTYDAFAAYWPHQTDNPFTPVLNERQKYVASTTLREPLPWQNSTVLGSDVPMAVSRLKEQLDHDVVVLGSGQLVQTLMAHDLVDEYLILIHPLVLGSGRRLFPDGVASPAALTLVDVKPTTTGVLLATYRPEHPAVASGSQGGSR